MKDNIGIEGEDKNIKKQDVLLKAEALKDNASVLEVMDTKGGRHFGRVWCLFICQP